MLNLILSRFMVHPITRLPISKLSIYYYGGVGMNVQHLYLS